MPDSPRDSAPSIPCLALRLPAASTAAGVSERTLWAWCREPNPPPHFRRNGCVLFPVRELADWLAEQAKAGEVTR